MLVSPGLLHPEQQGIRPLHPCRQSQSESPPCASSHTRASSYLLSPHASPIRHPSTQDQHPGFLELLKSMWNDFVFFSLWQQQVSKILIFTVSDWAFIPSEIKDACKSCRERPRLHCLMSGMLSPLLPVGETLKWYQNYKFEVQIPQSAALSTQSQDCDSYTNGNITGTKEFILISLYLQKIIAVIYCENLQFTEAKLPEIIPTYINLQSVLPNGSDQWVVQKISIRGINVTLLHEINLEGF